MKRRQYSVEFRREAVGMLLGGATAREVSEQLGVNQGLLYKWKSQQLDRMEASAKPGEPNPKEQAQEIARLRKELAKAQRMNQILKKAAVFFAQEEQ
ncbi:MAG: transposase [Cyanobacteria bacterium P01_C01_bin.147]